MSKQQDIAIAQKAVPSNKTNSWQSFVRYFMQNKWLYILLIPGMAFFIIFNYIPMYGIVIAFKDFDVVKGIGASPWIGLENFRYLFKSQDFYEVFRNSLLISLYRLIWGFPAPILLAIMLNEVKNITFKRTVQTIVYLPHFISWVVIAGIVFNFLSPSNGIINYIITEVFGGKAIPFLQKPEYFRSIIVISDIWKETGWGTIIYLAAMAGIDPELYEAAIMDGASRMQRIRYITLPGIIGTITVLFILRMGSVLRNGFEQIFLLYNPLVYEVADVFETYTYRVGLLEGRFSYSTAVGIFQSVIGLILILTTNKLAKKYGEGGLW
ncbi:ABC transporter permease [Mahella australiensis]|uniref:Carbohydrate ABC transporter membrane protein 1, CUT1 family n=1 Tax=Mahella australiensis (strain DSM 15567 / CIP 107919 / 50-1 BON) TaxID=697281 RepID=F4A120_MAHA5|nr:ABC transporter permease subunit [Mahella australiensis]AEE95923.1 carbohydrate ABC transporter membrane protein 1, CUT1 family [Mahella australiensis 50-1 BON]